MLINRNRINYKDLHDFRKHWLYYYDKEVGLTKAEYKILEQISHGKTAKECCKDLACEQTTVQKHLENIKMKNGIPTTSELIRMYWENQF